jgi:DNA repair protein RadC
MNDSNDRDYHPTIHDLPSSERPRERLKREGPTALSTAELLAIIFRVGAAGENVLSVSSRLLAKYGGLAGLARAPMSDLQAEYGLGEAKVIALKAAFELGRRLTIASPDERYQIRTPSDTANLLMGEMSVLEHEEMRVVMLDTRNRVIAITTAYQGSLNTSVVRVGELFREAIRRNAAAVIIVHNHPSGDPSPSPEDVSVTRAIIQAGQLLDVDVLDHLVIGQQRFVSLKDRGLAWV